MFERFTEKAIKAIMLAQEEARRLGHNFVGTEQILLGLIGEGTDIAARCLKAQGLNLKTARLIVQNHIGRGDGKVSVEIPFTPRCKRALEAAWNEARELGHNYIGTEHLLLGLNNDDRGLAIMVMQELHVDQEKLRTDVLTQIQFAALKVRHASLPEPGIPDRNMPVVFFNRFSDQLRACIVLAQEEARFAGNNEVEVEDIMLGIACEASNEAAKILVRHNITLETLRQQLADRLVKAAPLKSPVEIWLSTQSRALIEKTLEFAKKGVDEITPEHLMLNIINDEECVAVKCLKALDLDIFEYKEELEAFVDAGKTSEVQQVDPIVKEESQFFRNLADSTIKTFLFAQGEVRRAKRFEVGTEDILIGILGEESSLAARAMVGRNITLAGLRQALETIEPAVKKRPRLDFQFSAESREILDLSWKLAAECGHKFLSPDHLCVTILQQPESVALDILSKQKIDVEELLGVLNDFLRAPDYESVLVAEALAVRNRDKQEQDTSAEPEQPVASKGGKISKFALDLMANESVAVIVHAQDEASRTGHDMVGSGHLLLGLIAGHHDSAMKALRSRGIYLSEARAELKAICGMGLQPSVEVNRFSPRVQQIFCKTQARRGESPGRLVLPEDILLALLEESEGEGIRILEGLGCNIDDLRHQLLQLGQSPVGGVAERAGWQPEPLTTLTECFTTDAVRVVKLADKEAHEAGSDRIGTEHLVVALYLEGLSRASQSLRNQGVVLDSLRAVSRKISPHCGPSPKEDLPFSANLKAVFQRAFTCAQSVGLKEIGPDHLMLGLIGISGVGAWIKTNEDDCTGVQVLRCLGVELSSLKSFIVNRDNISPTKAVREYQNSKISPELQKSNLVLKQFSASSSLAKFDSDALMSVLIAHEEARKQGRNLVGSEQLLLGLLLEPNGKAGKLLRSIPLDLDFVRQTIEEITGGPESPEFKTAPYTMRARGLFGFAYDDLKSDQAVSSAKLLLTLLRDPYCIGSKILRLAGVDTDSLKKMILADEGDKIAVLHSDSPNLVAAHMHESGLHFPLFSDRFSDSLATTIELAKTLANAKSGGIASPEHLFLALVSLPSLSCAETFEELDMDKEETRVMLTSAIEKNAKPATQFFVFSPLAKQIVRLAFQISRFEGAVLVQPKHLLRAIIHLDTNHMSKLVKTNQSVSYLSLKGLELSPAAENVMRIAANEARLLGHNFVGTEQVLLGLVQASGIAAQALSEFRVDYLNARKEAERIIGRGKGVVADNIPLTSGTKRVLTNASQVTRERCQKLVDPEHLLLGLLCEGKGVAIRVLENIGVDLCALKNEVMRLMAI